MPLQHLPLTGFVLTGGMSRRMGKPKQDVLLNAETMLARQLRLLRRICSTIAVVGRTEVNTTALRGGEEASTSSCNSRCLEPVAKLGLRDVAATLRRHSLSFPSQDGGIKPPLRVLQHAVEPVFYSDELPGHGPLGGIYTGLMRTRSEYNFFLSCDLPFLNPGFLDLLASRALAAQADVTAPESPDHRYQPLCAVYRRRVRGIIRSFLAQDENKTTRFYRHVRCEIVRFAEIARAGFGPLVFMNMNTPEDYEFARSFFEPRKHILPGATEG